jgi:xylulokinase
MVPLDEDGAVVRPAILWNDMRSAPQARALAAELGGPGEWARRTGSVPTMSFTVTRLRWLAECEPASAARTACVVLPHDWLSWRLRGGPGESGEADPGTRWPREGPDTGARPVTDRGDASGTGYFATAKGEWLPEIAETAIGHPLRLPRVAGPGEVTGETGWGAAVSAGTGDNMGAALGLGVGEGDVVVSIGTSGTAYSVTGIPAADATGAVAGFADATGRYLPLVATVNAARVLTVTAGLLGTDTAGLTELALAAPPGAGGLTLLPYLDGERTPNRPGASGVLSGLTSSSVTRENLARAAVEAVLCSLADGIDHLAACGLGGPPGGQGGSSPQGSTAGGRPPGQAQWPERVVLIGGAARSPAIRAIAPAIFGVPVTVPEPAEYVALGAARQAAWALSGTAEPPEWPGPPATSYTGEPSADVRERYAALREDTAPWHERNSQ